MALAHSPRIVTDGLVLALDAGNLKSYDKYENLLKYSEQFDNAIWVKQNSHPITSNSVVAPDGNLTADTFYRTATNQFIYQSITGTGTYTLSAWVRSQNATGSFVMQPYNSTDGNPGVQTFTATNVWQRFSITSTITTNSGWYPCIPVNINENFYVWGAQLEKGSVANDYYPVTTTAKNRGTTWYDLSGNGNNGTLTNGPTYSGSNGGIITLDGVNDYIDITTPNLSTSNYTVMGASRYVNIGGRTFSGKNNNWLMGHWSTTTRNYYAQGWVSSTNNGESDTNWRIYAATGDYSGDSWAFYVNGQLDTGPNSGGANGPNGFSIGRFALGNGGSGSEYSNSQVSFLICYNRVLTTSEIQQNYNALKSRFIT